jgi:hypothetical protein
VPVASPRRLLGVGLLQWASLWALPIEATSGMPLIERLVMVGPILVVPLGLSPQRRLTLPLLAAGLLSPPLSLMLPPGPTSMAVASVWLLATARLALTVGVRLLTRLRREGVSSVPLDQLVADLGVLYLPVGAAWWVLSRKGGGFLQFDAAIVTLTAAHFHFAGFAAATIAALVGGSLGSGTAPRWLTATYQPAALIVGLGPPLVAVGITFSPRVEVLSAITLALGVLGMAVVMLAGATRAALAERRPAAGLGIAFSGLCLFVTMALAVGYATGEFTGAQALPIPTMVRLHGLLNVLGFATVGLLSLGQVRAVVRAADRRHS